MFLLTHMGLWLSGYLLRIAMAHVVKGSMSFIMIFFIFFFNNLKLPNFDGFSSDLPLTHLRFVWFEKSHNMLSLQEGAEREACNPSNSLEDEAGGEVSTVQVPHHVTTQPHLPTTPHHHYNHKNSLPRIMWTDDKKKSPYTCLFLCLCFFIYCVEWNVPHGFFSGRICEKLFSEICMYANYEWPKHGFFRNHQVRKPFAWNVGTASPEVWA